MDLIKESLWTGINSSAQAFVSLKPVEGIEPPTYALQVRRSTTELHRLTAFTYSLWHHPSDVGAELGIKYLEGFSLKGLFFRRNVPGGVVCNRTTLFY